MPIKHSDYNCPVCDKPLSDNDVVVCPECGAPYHRECYLKEGQCIFPDLHALHEEWKPPKKEPPEFDGMSALRCPRCATENPPHGLFCQVCGAELNDRAREQQDDTQASPFDRQQPSSYQANGQAPFMGANIPLNPYTTPFGGVAPNEEIDGIPAKELAIFVGRNSHYYLPHFKAIATTKTRIINWAAFIFTGGHFIYRKMYLYGIIVLLINIILAVPSAVMMYNTLSTGMVSDFNSVTAADMTGLASVNFICNMLLIAVRFACGMLCNTLYKRHAYKKIKEIKSMDLPEQEYYGMLTKKGSVAIKLITGLLIAYFILNVISMFMILMFGL